MGGAPSGGTLISGWGITANHFAGNDTASGCRPRRDSCGRRTSSATASRTSGAPRSRTELDRGQPRRQRHPRRRDRRGDGRLAQERQYRGRRAG
jgi:hypothetical protein